MKTLALLFAALLPTSSLPEASADPLKLAPLPTTGLLSDIDVSDGIDEPEARIIADAYFKMHVGCGVYEGISNSSEVWVVEGKYGYSGDPIRGFFINKKTGSITSPIGQSYSRPSDMFLLGPNNSFKPNPHQGAAWLNTGVRGPSQHKIGPET